MHDDLSVKENLTMYAGLRLPATLKRCQRLAVVRDVMAVLEIDRIAHAVTLTPPPGGDRRRREPFLNIQWK
jgi:ABC-type multidrug transport system ATPase subunit